MSTNTPRGNTLKRKTVEEPTNTPRGNTLKRKTVEEPQCRPFGEQHQRILTERLWKNIQDWMTPAFEMDNPNMTIKSVLDLKSEVHSFYMSFNRPHKFETRLSSFSPDDPHHPNTLMESFLYGKVYTALQIYIQRIKQKWDIACLSNNNFEDEMHKLYMTYGKEAGRYSTACNMLNMILASLNESWIKKQLANPKVKRVFKIDKLSQLFWRENIFSSQNEEIPNLIRDFLLKEIKLEREGVEFDMERKNVLKSCLKSLQSSGFEKESELFVFNPRAKEEFITLSPVEKRRRLKLWFYLPFETTFYEHTETFFINHMNQYTETEDGKDIRKLMKYVYDRIMAEEARVKICLDPSTRPKLMEILNSILILDKLDKFSQLCVKLLEENKKQDVGMLYQILSRGGPTVEAAMAETFESIMTTRGQQKIKELCNKNRGKLPNCKQFCEEMIALYDDHLSLIKDVMENNRVFYEALNRACATMLKTNIITQNPKKPIEVNRMNAEKPSEYLAQYTDAILKYTNKGEAFFADDEISKKTLASIVELVARLSGKDRFMSLFKHYLAKRLVHQTARNLDLEKEFVDILNTRCNVDSNGFNVMFRDILNSRELSKRFIEEHKRFLFFQSKYGVQNDWTWTPLKFQLTAIILTNAHWPFTAKSFPQDWTLPDDIQQGIEDFKQYYTKKRFTQRKLEWCLPLQRGELNWYPNRIKSNWYTLITNITQTSVLLFFENKDEATYEDIQIHTMLNDEDLTKTLNILTKGVSPPRKPRTDNEDYQKNDTIHEDKILIRLNPDGSVQEPPEPEKKITGKIFEAHTVIKVNEKFKSPMRKINLFMLFKTEDRNDLDRLAKKVTLQRKHKIEAKIVQLMKAKRRFKKSELKNQVFEQVSASNTIQIEMNDVANRVEDLIGRCFMEYEKEDIQRDDTSFLIYIA